MADEFTHVDVNPRLECAETLASRFYRDPGLLALEKERIFRRTWQLVGTLNQPCGEVNGAKRTIADPESYFTFDLAGEPIVVVRDATGTLRVFSNVCRHRAGPIAEGAGCRKVLNCGYHGWTYTLDGRLIGTPEVDGVELFDRSTMGMVPLRCATWQQFIFANFSNEGPSLSEYLGNIPDRVRGRRTTGYTLEGDHALQRMFGSGFLIPHYPQTVLEEVGSRYSRVGANDPYVIRDCKLVTGQNQQSASEYALVLLHTMTGQSPVLDS